MYNPKLNQTILVAITFIILPFVIATIDSTINGSKTKSTIGKVLLPGKMKAKVSIIGIKIIPEIIVADSPYPTLSSTAKKYLFLS